MKSKDYLPAIAENTPVMLVVNECELRTIIEDVVNETILKYDESQKEEKYLTINTVIDMLKVTRATLWRWANDGYLVPLKVGKRTLYRESDVNAYLKVSK